MANHRSEFVREVVARAYLHQCTDLAALDALAAQQRVSAYIGFDCTAPSLHVGSLVQIMLLRRLQQAGHRPIVLMGGGTTKIGDPSGKDEARRLLTDDQIAQNMAGIRAVFERFLTFGDGPADAVMVDNAEWLDELKYIPLLREIGPHFSINRMLTFDSVRMRLEREQPLSFLEFNYMILQAYDFVELSRRHGCRLQMGGSDQWGNIVNGVELSRRLGGTELFGLTAPLITTASGAKMGKTAQGAVWLSADLLSPYEYWQFWRNTEDADVGRFLRLFTDLPEAEIARLEGLQGAELNDAKKVLANEATALLHGAAAAADAARVALCTFDEGGLGEALPQIALPRAELEAGLPLFVALAKAGLTGSSSEGRRKIREGGVRVNDAVVSDEQRTLTPADLTGDGVIKLSLGRKRHALVQPA